MPSTTIPAFALFVFVSILAPANAADLASTVLARNQWTQLLASDYEAALQRIPENKRIAFATDPKRIQTLLNGLLVTKTLAAQARAHGLAHESFKTSGDLADRALADLELRRLAEDSTRSFEARRAAFEARAREIYKLDREKYRMPEEVRLSDIAVLTKDRGDEAARARAEEARQRIVAGADFAKVAQEYSDDPTTKDKGGALPFVTADRLAPEYGKAAFGLEIGEISEPIRGPAAYHIVRVEERRPSRIPTFEEVHDRIMDELRDKYVREQRELRIQAIFNDSSLEVNQPAVDALVQRIDPTVLEPRRSQDKR